MCVSFSKLRHVINLLAKHNTVPVIERERQRQRTFGGHC